MPRSSRAAAGPAGLRPVLALVAAAGPLWAGAASAQNAQQQDSVSTIDSTGSLGTFTSANPGRLHLSLGLGVDSGDFFRGGFDGERENLDALAYRAGIAGTVELVDDPDMDIDLTVGSANGFSDEAFAGSPLEEDSGWYESNNYIGLTAQFGGDWLGGVTYTNYATPLDDFENTHELAVAALYDGDSGWGRLKPQVKLATRLDDPEGWYAEAGIAPGMDLAWPGEGPASLSFPVTVGYGWDDYYGRGSDDTGYVSGGVHGALPLFFVPEPFGSWSLSAGVDLIYRPDDLRDTQPSFADDALVAVGMVRLNLRY